MRSDSSRLSPVDPTHWHGARHWTIWGISLQAFAFFFASAIQGGSSCGKAGADRPRWEDGACPEVPGALLSWVVLDEKGGEVTVGLWGCVVFGTGREGAALERDGGLVQGDFWGTGTGVGCERDLGAELGWGWGFVKAGRTWGFGGTGQGSDGDFEGGSGTGVGGGRVLLASFSIAAEGLLISNTLAEPRQKHTCVKQTRMQKHVLKLMRNTLYLTAYN